MKMIICCTLFFLFCSNVISQSNFKGKITYKVKTQSSEMQDFEDFYIYTFQDSSVTIEYSNGKTSKSILNFAKGTYTFINRETTESKSLDAINEDSTSKKNIGQKLFLTDTLTILNILCLKAQNKNEYEGEGFISVKGETFNQYYLSNLYYTCPNPYYHFDPICNNGFNKIPLNFMSIDKTDFGGVKSRTDSRIFEAMSIEPM